MREQARQTLCTSNVVCEGKDSNPKKANTLVCTPLRSTQVCITDDEDDEDEGHDAASAPQDHIVADE